MAGNDRADDAAAAAPAARELHERIGHAQDELDAARARLQQLQQQRAATQEQVEAAEREIEQLRRELQQRLGQWCAFEDLDVRCERLAGVVGRIEAVQRSFTYRAVSALLRLVNKARAFCTFAWLRRASAERK
jgi:chromosome segregation ATPase